MAKGSGYSGGRGGGSYSGRSGGSPRGGSSGSSGGISGSSRRSSASEGSKTGSGAGASSTGGSSSAQRAANSRMWSRPATAKQIATLKANGTFDGEYYSSGRAGQTIGESARAASSTFGPTIPDGGVAQRGQASRRDRDLDISGLSEALGAVVRLQRALEPPRVGARDSAGVLGQDIEEYRSAPIDVIAAPPEGQFVREYSGVLSFAFVNDLADRHLRSFQSQFGPSMGNLLRRETQAWGDARIALAKKITDGQADLAAILDESPAEAIASPAVAVNELLANAYPLDLEERHLRSFQAEYGPSMGDFLRKEILAWADNRIERAKVNARFLVKTTMAQAAIGSAQAVRESAARSARQNAERPATPRGELGEESQTTAAERSDSQVHDTRTGVASGLGTVTSIKPMYGAVISLESGRQGWLHISKLRVLNDGNRVESVDGFLRVGERIRVTEHGVNARGQILLALVTSSQKLRPAVGSNAKTAQVETPKRNVDSTSQAVTETGATPSVPLKRRGILSRLFQAHLRSGNPPL